MMVFRFSMINAKKKVYYRKCCQLIFQDQIENFKIYFKNIRLFLQDNVYADKVSSYRRIYGDKVCSDMVFIQKSLSGYNFLIKNFIRIQFSCSKVYTVFLQEILSGYSFLIEKLLQIPFSYRKFMRTLFLIEKFIWIQCYYRKVYPDIVLLQKSLSGYCFLIEKFICYTVYRKL